jgi:hypothetical protein
MGQQQVPFRAAAVVQGDDVAVAPAGQPLAGDRQD